MGRAGNFEESADDRICRSKLIDAHDRDCQAIVVVVAKDSGTDHLFGAGACPIVSLFGPTDPRRWAPFAALQKTVWTREFGGGAILSVLQILASG